MAAATVSALMETMAEAAAALFPPFSSIVGRLVVDPIMAWSGLPIELVKMTEQRGGFFHTGTGPKMQCCQWLPTLHLNLSVLGHQSERGHLEVDRQLLVPPACILEDAEDVLSGMVAQTLFVATAQTIVPTSWRNTQYDRGTKEEGGWAKQHNNQIRSCKSYE